MILGITNYYKVKVVLISLAYSDSNWIKSSLEFRAMSINKVLTLCVYLHLNSSWLYQSFNHPSSACLNILLRVDEQSAVARGAVSLEALLTIARCPLLTLTPAWPGLTLRPHPAPGDGQAAEQVTVTLLILSGAAAGVTFLLNVGGFCIFALLDSFLGAYGAF